VDAAIDAKSRSTAPYVKILNPLGIAVERRARQIPGGHNEGFWCSVDALRTLSGCRGLALLRGLLRCNRVSGGGQKLPRLPLAACL